MEISFFDPHGITSTSANYIANLSKEYAEESRQFLTTLKFVNRFVKTINVEKYDQIDTGIINCDLILYHINYVSECNQLNAWLREAIKAKAELTDKAQNLTFQDYLDYHSITINAPLNLNSPVEQDIINKLSIKDRYNYFKLEAICSTLGQVIHPSKSFSLARKKMHSSLTNSAEITTLTDQILIYKYEPSISVDEVESLFFQLQNQWREAQAQLNGIKHKIEIDLKNAISEYRLTYGVKLEEYKNEKNILLNKYSLWQAEELKKASNLKIAIPNDLQARFDIINGTAKK